MCKGVAFSQNVDLLYCKSETTQYIYWIFYAKILPKLVSVILLNFGTHFTHKRKSSRIYSSPKRLGPGLIPPPKKKGKQLGRSRQNSLKNGSPLNGWRCHTSHPPDHRLGLTGRPPGPLRQRVTYGADGPSLGEDAWDECTFTSTLGVQTPWGRRYLELQNIPFSTPNLSRYFGRLGQWLVVNG